MYLNIRFVVEESRFSGLFCFMEVDTQIIHKKVFIEKGVGGSNPSPSATVIP